MDAAMIRQSSRFSVRIATMASSETWPLWTMTSSQMGSYIQFLEHNFELVNEIGPAFCPQRLAIIGGGSGSGLQNLTAHMPAMRCSGQLRGQANNGRCKRNESFF
jgi:hypothetical protein